MATRPSTQPRVVVGGGKTWDGLRPRRYDRYAVVLVLVILDYIAMSTVSTIGERIGRPILVALLGITLLIALRTSRARSFWRRLVLVYLFASTLLALTSALIPGQTHVGQDTTILAGVLLIVTPLIILRRIAAETAVTNETVFGALCVYLLFGFSFASIFMAIGAFTTPFFGHAGATMSDYLFFSFSTLTTVGYGNLVPATSLGQTFAMLEALTGQVYLVIIVARLVSLWAPTRKAQGSTDDGTGSGVDAPQGAVTE